MMHIHDLGGCAPAPLAHYLKALGVLRLVAEQADPQARGWWEGERFRVATCLTMASFETFLLHDYRPTPLVCPWNGGSGFYPGDKKARKVHDAILASTSVRFEGAKAAINQARSLVDRRKEAPEGRDKDRFISACIQHWRGEERQWLRAALTVNGQGNAKFPALLGTGGNDRRFDFSSNYLVRLASVVGADGQPTANSLGLLKSALWGELSANLLTGAAGKVGQFLPGGAGGANSVNGPGDQDSTLLNPWDFVLMLEGTMVLTASTAKRLDALSGNRAAAPFVATAHAAGYASAGDTDEAARGEQWMPLWSQPMTYSECRRLFAEGRVQIGRATAQQPLDMARAVARLGAARGIAAFQRFGYIERNGQSNLAVPLGRFKVRETSAAQIACLDDLAAWVSRVKRAAADSDGSIQLRQVTRRLGDTFLEAAQRPEHPLSWQALLLCVADVEGVMKSGTGFKAQPAPPLRPEWVEAADDGSPGFRLALASALQARAFRRDTLEPIDPVRRHWLPLDARQARPRFATTGDAMHPRLEKRADVVMPGRFGIDDAVALVERRIFEATRSGAGLFGLQPAPRASAQAADLSAWLQGRVDPDRTLALARALMALDRGLWAEQVVRQSRPAAAGDLPDDTWLCIRLAHLPWPLPDGRRVPCDPAILRRLASGDGATALQLALRRLWAVGIRPGLRAAAVPAATARLWAAALAFPISRKTAGQLVARIDNHFAQEQLA